MTMARYLLMACGMAALGMLWMACFSSELPPYTPRECQVDAHCRRGPEPMCGRSSCVGGQCQYEFFEKSRSQIRGDCHTTLCNEDGDPYVVSDPEDVNSLGRPCWRFVCYRPGGSRYVVLPRAPLPDGSGFCDGDGHLVACLSDADCHDPALYCSKYDACIPLECKNAQLDPAIGESSIDCGGRCDRCPTPSDCNTGDDCLSRVCDHDKRCAVVRCDDGVQNGGETDVDCGGRCDPCADGAGCFGGTDCDSGVCFGGKCQPPTCGDGIGNGTEESVDCGGDCPPCD